MLCNCLKTKYCRSVSNLFERIFAKECIRYDLLIFYILQTWCWWDGKTRTFIFYLPMVCVKTKSAQIMVVNDEVHVFCITAIYGVSTYIQTYSKKAVFVK